MTPPLERLVEQQGRARFRDDVLAGFAARPKTLPSKYFYDAAGSALFDQICVLPEYYLTRVERALMTDVLPELAEWTGPRAAILEYGSGSGEKTRQLLAGLRDPVAYVPIDISPAPLYAAAARMRLTFPGLAVEPLAADFTQPLALPPLPMHARRVLYFPGSTIGNLLADEAVALLRGIARRVGAGGGLLLGADLQKDPAVLHAAYNDAGGVTAAFNRNLLARIRRELESDIEPERFWHHAIYNPAAGRIEMYLIAQDAHAAQIDGTTVRFAEGESILTEYSHKYTVPSLTALVARGGFTVERVWTDAMRQFAILALAVTAPEVPRA